MFLFFGFIMAVISDYQHNPLLQIKNLSACAAPLALSAHSHLIPHLTLRSKDLTATACPLSLSSLPNSEKQGTSRHARDPPAYLE